MSSQKSEFTLGAPFWLALAAMIAVIIVSNFAVARPVPALAELFGTGDGSFNYGQFTFPLAFLITDIVNRLFGAKLARLIAASAFVIAVPVSIWLNYETGAIDFAVRIGLASGVAFIVGQLLDISIFQWLRNQAWWVGPLAGSLIASLIDTVIFYGIAFTGQPWVVSAGTIDFAVKVAVALVALLPFRLVIARALSQDNAAK